jgi:hypothetical protein
LQATLRGDREFLAEILPGDWVMAWMVNTHQDYLDLMKNLRAGTAANGWKSGLKFMGQVENIRKVLVHSEAGMRSIQYNLSANGFTQLDIALYFEQAFARSNESEASYLARIGVSLKSLYESTVADTQNGKGGISGQKFISEIIRILLGSGIPPQSDKLNINPGAATDEAPYSFIVPTQVGNLLGILSPSKDLMSYGDVLETMLGKQTYSSFNDNSELVFAPYGVGSGSRMTTNNPLEGLFVVQSFALNNKPIWSLIQDYLNGTINEAYTAMRWSPNGGIMPTLIARQLPFSTPILKEKLGSQVTSFHELPRWVLSTPLIRGLDVGRSNGPRLNYIHVSAHPTMQQGHTDIQSQMLRSPPVADNLDIKRHGQRSHMTSVACSPHDAVYGLAKWNMIISDILLGQHLLLNGTCSTVGIAAPIVPGDNLEYDGVVYHIESVSHSCSVSPNGVRHFITQLSLTHGCNANVDVQTQKITVNKRSKVNSTLLSLYTKWYSTKASEAKAAEARAQQIGYKTKDDLASDLNAQASDTEQIEVTYQDGSVKNPDLALYTGLLSEDHPVTTPVVTVENDDNE